MIIEQSMRDGVLVNNFIYEESDLSTSIERENWLTVCSTCEFYDNEQCSKCGCIAKTIMTFPTSKCPINKW